MCSCLLGLLLLGGCQSATQDPDLARNEQLYRRLAFTSKLPGDRAVFVAPLQDARHVEVLPASQSGFPITYDADGRWSRPVTVMVDDVLRDELQQSSVFAGLLPAARPEALVLMPTLTDFQSGVVELDVNARTHAEIGIRVQLFAACDAAGRRQLLLDQIYSDRETSTAAMVPMSTYRLMGRAMNVAMQRLVSGLDTSNVGRSNMPVEELATPPAGVPVPAK